MPKSMRFTSDASHGKARATFHLPLKASHSTDAQTTLHDHSMQVALQPVVDSLSRCLNMNDDLGVALIGTVLRQQLSIAEKTLEAHMTAKQEESKRTSPLKSPAPRLKNAVNGSERTASVGEIRAGIKQESSDKRRQTRDASGALENFVREVLLSETEPKNKPTLVEEVTSITKGELLRAGLNILEHLQAKLQQAQKKE